MIRIPLKIYQTQILPQTYPVLQNESKQGCKDQESLQSSTTSDPGYQWESNKLTVDTKTI